MPRENIIMECTVCKGRNYFTTKNRRKHPERAEWKKYCPRCNKHQPHQEVVEIKNGKKVTAERKIYPGYVLVNMVLNQETIHVINGIQGVIKFVGTGRLPMPLRPEEVNRLLGIEEAAKEEEPQETIPFLVGQVVEITEGPFSDFSGTVEEVIPDKGKVRVAVSLFGRPT